MIIVTDRPNYAESLRGIIEVVEDCAIFDVNATRGSDNDHAVIICDVRLESGASVARARTSIALHRGSSGIPMLHLSRRRGSSARAEAEGIGATVVMPSDVSPEQILFMVRRLVESREIRSAGRGVPAPLEVAAQLRAAADVFSEALHAIRCGAPVSLDSLERGAQAIMSAVGGRRLDGWMNLVRSYDDITYQHSLLVAGLAAAFAARLKLSLNLQRLISKACLLHDVGKLAVPLEILNKPGPLDEREMQIVKQHPEMGYQLLRRQGTFDRRTLCIVRHHHEVLDGSGYPCGLREAEIPEMVRLVTICDIYAALVEKRSYKEPLPAREALAILRRMKGKLDQRLVDTFHDMIESE
jgi:putative nucleotidyltransferase with HDIG domain